MFPERCVYLKIFSFDSSLSAVKIQIYSEQFVDISRIDINIFSGCDDLAFSSADVFGMLFGFSGFSLFFFILQVFFQCYFCRTNVF